MMGPLSALMPKWEKKSRAESRFFLPFGTSHAGLALPIAARGLAWRSPASGFFRF
jgi:hypothetical protein